MVFCSPPPSILMNCANWFEVVAEVFEHSFSIWHVAGLLDLCTNFYWDVYKSYHIIHAEACINWQDVEIHAICQYFSFLTTGASSYEQVSLILTPVSANHLTGYYLSKNSDVIYLVSSTWFSNFLSVGTVYSNVYREGRKESEIWRSCSPLLDSSLSF